MIEKLPQLSAIDARVVMQDQYDRRYGLVSPDLARDPLASVTMLPCEDTTRGSQFYDLCREFASKKYREVWGLSIDEFLAHPVWVTDMLREITDSVLKEHSDIVERLGRETKVAK